MRCLLVVTRLDSCLNVLCMYSDPFAAVAAILRVLAVQVVPVVVPVQDLAAVAAAVLVQAVPVPVAQAPHHLLEKVRILHVK